MAESRAALATCIAALETRDTDPFDDWTRDGGRKFHNGVLNAALGVIRTPEGRLGFCALSPVEGSDDGQFVELVAAAPVDGVLAGGEMAAAALPEAVRAEMAEDATRRIGLHCTETNAYAVEAATDLLRTILLPERPAECED